MNRPSRFERSMLMRDKRAFVYLLEGPSGVYVGRTTRPMQREAEHRSKASARPTDTDLRVHRAMRRDGIEHYLFTVVACARGHYESEGAEESIIRQLRADGVRVLNIHPLVAGTSVSAERQAV